MRTALNALFYRIQLAPSSMQDAAPGSPRPRSCRVSKAYLVVAPLLLLSLGHAGSLQAQSEGAGTDANALESVEAMEGATQNMTLEELEAFVEAQKEALDKVRSSRDVTAEKEEKAREAKVEEDARRAEAKAEVEKLCEELEALESGSLDECMKTVEDD